MRDNVICGARKYPFLESIPVRCAPPVAPPAAWPEQPQSCQFLALEVFAVKAAPIACDKICREPVEGAEAQYAAPIGM